MQVLIPSHSNLKSDFSILHQVPEGHVGVYWRGGALLKTITDPGLSLSFLPPPPPPFIMLNVCPYAFIHIKNFRFPSEVATVNPVCACSSDPPD